MPNDRASAISQRRPLVDLRLLQQLSLSQELDRSPQGFELGTDSELDCRCESLPSLDARNGELAS